MVGKGAFGRVYKVSYPIPTHFWQAVDKRTNQVVAVKQILEDESMMNRETQILNQVGEHSNIICLRSHFYSLKPAGIPGEP